jgi:S1-C subfamily serine protease
VQVADVILGVDGVQTDSASEYLSLLRTYPPGAEVQLTLLRGIDERKTTLLLAELPEAYAKRYFKRIFGLVVDEDQRGVVISQVISKSPAALIELRPGDRISEIEGLRVSTLKEFFARIEANLGRLPLRFGVFRGNQGYLVELP